MSTVQLKRSAVASKVPVTADIALGELALNTYDGRLFFKKDSGTPAIVTVVTTGDTQTLTNKTLTSAVISGTLTANGSVGANNQVLTSNTTGVYWSTVSSGGGANLTLSSNGSTVSVNSDSGSDVVILAANATTAGVLTAEAQTIAGVKTFSNTIIGTANNALYLNGTIASGYQTTAGLSANVATLTSNNSSYLGGTIASGYQTTAGLSANVATLTSNNSSYLGGTIASGYQTTAGLSANVATLTANNVTNFNGQAAAYYANASNIGSGTLSPSYGGTGVNNGAKTITLGGNFTHIGAHTLGVTTTANTSVTLPTTGTLATTSNKLSAFAATTSAELAGVISDETGSGSLVFGTAPTFTTTIDGGATFGAFASSTALTLGYTGVAASTTNISTGAVATATTKTINLGTGAAAGSTTNINIGSSVAGTTTIASPNLTLSGLAATATAATHYYVQTTGGDILPKTLANARTEIVTTAAVNAAAATTTGTVTSGTWSASFGAVSGANLTSLTAGNLSGTIPSGVLGNSTVNIGTTAIALNRASLAQTLTGVGIDGNAGTVTNGVYTTGNQSIAGIKTFSNGTASTTNTTGSVVITGGLGVSGAINAGADVTAYATSDSRLKTNIENIPDALAKVNLLNGVTYNWNDLAHEVEHKDTSVKEVGVLAQQVNDVLPEVINIRDNGYMAVRYEKMVPLLIEAIKELTEQNRQLAQRLSDLEDNN